MLSRPPAGQTVRLPSDVRALLEYGYAADFRSVTVEITPAGGPPAVTVGERVVVSEPFYRPDTAFGRRLLAHEFAHVVQKRQTGRPAPVRWLEAEACAAAAVVAGGGRFACRLADHPATPRGWEEGGHYYTVYMVFLAAGATNADAQQMALYCQFPDMVDVVDACANASNWASSKTSRMGGAFSTTAKKNVSKAWENGSLWHPFDMAGSMIDGVNAAVLNAAVTGALTTTDKEQLAWYVYRGLHCLTGNPAEQETQKRRDILMKEKYGSFRFGLALHAFGDSYAHRMLSNYATAYVEKAAQSYKKGEMYSFPAGHGGDRHEPDLVYTRPELYQEYVMALYDVAREKLSGAKPLIERKVLEDHIAFGWATGGDHPWATTRAARAIGSKVTSNIDDPNAEAVQIQGMRDLVNKFGQPMTGFAPEKMSQRTNTWAGFKQQFPDFTDHDLQTALDCAKEWSK